MWTERAIVDVPTEEPGTFRVLAVCTGNICRSPAVERLLGAALGPSVRVTSAGTQALVGHGIADPMAELLRARGADTEGFSARQLDAPLVARADLVLALTREHRSAAVGMHPRALRRAFTLRELARLVSDLPPEELAGATTATEAERLRALVPLALSRRGQRPADPREDDVVDPWRRSAAVYRESLGQIADALETLTRALGRG